MNWLIVLFLACPDQCVQWYNGCNWCQCESPGKIGVCTKRECAERTRPYCTKWQDRPRPDAAELAKLRDFKPGEPDIVPASNAEGQGSGRADPMSQTDSGSDRAPPPGLFNSRN